MNFVGVLIAGSDASTTKGSPEDVLRACTDIPSAAQGIFAGQYATGARVAAVATRSAPDLQKLTPADEARLTLIGFLVFLDRPKTDSRASLEELARLGITVKIATS